jgi:bifunctional DNA-binding transcriptional regulator/antitoxin component of YhaV-PrlF toxin-antitoxin module
MMEQWGQIAMAQLAQFERKVDSKRRIALPAGAGIDANQNAFLTVSDDVIVVARRKQVSQQVFEALKDALEVRKLNALKEWEMSLKEAGLFKLSSARIDKIVDQSFAAKRRRD